MSKKKDRVKYLGKILNTIKSKNLFFIEQIPAFVNISKTTIYEYYPNDSNDLDAIKDALSENKLKTKAAIQAKWFRSARGTDNLLLYKLIGTSDERKKLSTNYQEHSGEIDNKTVNIVVDNKTDASKLSGLINGYSDNGNVSEDN